ncbi:hypothetical protein AgCh_021277 [Apium graveolens]
MGITGELVESVFSESKSIRTQTNVRICKEKSIGHVYAMKKLKKSEMLRRGQEDQERVKLLMDIEELSIQKPNNGGASRARNASPSCFCRS